MSASGSFDRFTERARMALALAQEEAQRFNHRFIGPEYLLLGLVREGEGVPARVLAEAGVDLDRARAAVEVSLGSGGESGSEEPGLTPQAKKVLELSVDEARRLGHHYIGPEHLLLGLIREGEGIGAAVLESLGVELTKVRSVVEFIIGRGERQVVGEIGPTPRAKKVIALASDEAQRLGHNYIGTEHLLLGLIREGEGIAAGVLESLGVNLQRVRSAVIKVLTQTGPVLSSGPPARPWLRWEYLAVHAVYREGMVRVQTLNGVEDPRFKAGETPIHDVLRALGEEGWELSGIDPLGGAGSALYVFKRRKRPQSAT